MEVKVVFNKDKKGLHARSGVWSLYPLTGSLIEDWKVLRDTLSSDTLLASVEVHAAMYHEFELREADRLKLSNTDWPAPDYIKGIPQ